MKEVLYLDTMITPKIINVIYWLALLFVIVGGLFMVFFGSFWAGLGIIVGGSIGTRIYCEIMIILFKIYESLRVIADNSSAK
ncbi:DUF4282 domain-containing protein [Reinekea thalattae]|uniref:DUF4282 domain-containing protein n=1 Tax=Reinekea thalattae TaxID=2593301 RepID=A0A5C8Z985_9GAMM|nr:DUF4282 domain-containing protein [Reinekea thalattae]TXR53711.1 DUF4282 domain-containing protein [Reinekea thalattae]